MASQESGDSNGPEKAALGQAAGPNPATGPGNSGARRSWHWNWDCIFERIADIPWGVLLLIVLGILLAFGLVRTDDIRAFATAAGLFGIGHGIHTGAKHFAKQGKTLNRP